MTPSAHTALQTAHRRAEELRGSKGLCLQGPGVISRPSGTENTGALVPPGSKNLWAF